MNFVNGIICLFAVLWAQALRPYIIGAIVIKLI